MYACSNDSMEFGLDRCINFHYVGRTNSLVNRLVLLRAGAKDPPVLLKGGISHMDDMVRIVSVYTCK